MKLTAVIGTTFKYPNRQPNIPRTPILGIRRPERLHIVVDLLDTVPPYPSQHRQIILRSRAGSHIQGATVECLEADGFEP